MAEEFKGEYFECLGENTEIYISFSVPVKKERDNDGGETITHKIKFIDSYRLIINNKDCKTCGKEKILNQNVNLLGLKMID